MCCLWVTGSRRPRRCLLTPGEGELTSFVRQFIGSRESLFLESSIRGASLITDTQPVLILPSRDPRRFIPAGKTAGKEPRRTTTSSHSGNRAYGQRYYINLSCLLKAGAPNLRDLKLDTRGGADVIIGEIRYMTNVMDLNRPETTAHPYPLPGALVVKNPPVNVGDVRDEGSISGLRRSPGGGHGHPLQYACLENPHGQRSLAGYGPWGRKESDTTEGT